MERPPTLESGLRRPWLLLAWFMISLLPVGAFADDTLTLGRISDDPARHYGQLRPLLDYVIPRMREVGIRSGRVLMARDAGQMATYLRRGRVDWVTETPGTAMLLRARSGARLMALTERSGVRAYRSLIVVRDDSPLQRLTDLAGQRIAFERPTSTSAYLVPASELLAARLALDPMIDMDDRPSADRTGYLFALSEANVRAWINTGLVDAGAISDLGQPDLQLGSRLANDSGLRVLHRTEPFPRGVELARADLKPEIRDRLVAVLLAASQDPEAGPALSAFFDTTAFLPVDAETRAGLETMREDVSRVWEQVE